MAKIIKMKMNKSDDSIAVGGVTGDGVTVQPVSSVVGDDGALEGGLGTVQPVTTLGAPTYTTLTHQIDQMLARHLNTVLEDEAQLDASAFWRVQGATPARYQTVEATDEAMRVAAQQMTDLAAVDEDVDDAVSMLGWPQGSADIKLIGSRPLPSFRPPAALSWSLVGDIILMLRGTDSDTVTAICHEEATMRDLGAAAQTGFREIVDCLRDVNTITRDGRPIADDTGSLNIVLESIDRIVPHGLIDVAQVTEFAWLLACSEGYFVVDQVSLMYPKLRLPMYYIGDIEHCAAVGIFFHALHVPDFRDFVRQLRKEASVEPAYHEKLLSLCGDDDRRLLLSRLLPYTWLPKENWKDSLSGDSVWFVGLSANSFPVVVITSRGHAGTFEVGWVSLLDFELTGRTDWAGVAAKHEDVVNHGSTWCNQMLLVFEGRSTKCLSEAINAFKIRT